MNFRINNNTSAEKKVAIAMSGGVDSTVSTLLLIEKGYNVVGITAIMHEEMENEAQNASKACELIGIEHHVIDLKEKFNQTVRQYFENTYQQGLTPNPCTYCNRHIKWDTLARYAFVELNADFYATGHYAKILPKKNNFRLYRGEDLQKDQSYMLFALTHEHLSRTIFPLGSLKKSEVRQIAQKHNLVDTGKKESQDVCFICPPETTQSYLIGKFGENKGEIVDYESGKVLGLHKGAFNYTIGQRKGIGVAAETPLYVISINPQENKIYVGQKNLLFSSEFKVIDVNWQQEDYAGKSEFGTMVKIRYNSPAQEAVVVKTSVDTVHVYLKEPKSAITPGQAAVFYDINNEYIIGGGWIK